MSSKVGQSLMWYTYHRQPATNQVPSQAVLIAACQEAIQIGAIEPVLHRFIAMPLVA